MQKTGTIAPNPHPPDNDCECASCEEAALVGIYGPRGVNMSDLPAPVVNMLGQPAKVDPMKKVVAEVMAKEERKPVDKSPKRVVIATPDQWSGFPEMYIDVYLHGPAGDIAGFPEMFARARCNKAETPDKADLIVFGGGSDVNPYLYGKEAHRRTHYNIGRDKDDIEMYEYALASGIPMFGVCRGAQFLHVMNGGTLFQHIDGHNGSHSIWDINGKTYIDKVSSVHHQSVYPDTKTIQVLATASTSKERWSDDKTQHMVGVTIADVEAFFYRDTMCLGVQGHPEYKGYGGFTLWCLQQIQHHLICSPDIKLSAGNYRVHPDRMGRVIAPLYIAGDIKKRQDEVMKILVGAK